MLRWFAGFSRGFFQAFYVHLRADRSQLAPIYGCLCLFIRNEVIEFIRVTLICTLFSRVRQCRSGTVARNRRGAWPSWYQRIDVFIMQSIYDSCYWCPKLEVRVESDASARHRTAGTPCPSPRRGGVREGDIPHAGYQHGAASSRRRTWARNSRAVQPSGWERRHIPLPPTEGDQLG